MKDASSKSTAGQLTVALAGNPNAGKSTLFNALTGLNQKVANYPGVTVERKMGVWHADGKSIDLIDLPGLYSLDATSLDEHIASDVLLGKVAGLPKPDAVIAVVDATNLERNLYLVTQLFEFGVPVVVALTMIDLFEKQEHEIDVQRLSELLNVPVVAVDASEGRGIDELAFECLLRDDHTCSRREHGERPLRLAGLLDLLDHGTRHLPQREPLASGIEQLGRPHG